MNRKNIPLLIGICCILSLASGCKLDATDRAKIVQESFEMKIRQLNFNGDIDNMYAFANRLIFKMTDGRFEVLNSKLLHDTAIEQVFRNLECEIKTGFEYEGQFIFLCEKNHVIVFDSLFNRNKTDERKLNAIHPVGILKVADGIWFNSHDNLCHLGKKFKITNTTWDSFCRAHISFCKGDGEYIYSDSLYDVYACGVGEFGGNAYFEDKNLHKIFSYPMYFNDFLQYNDRYYLFEGSDMHSRYMTVDNPSRLYQPNFRDSVRCCNCDSLSKKFYGLGGQERRKEAQSLGIHIYFDSLGIQTVTSFTHLNNLYSFAMTDSSFLILQHQDSVIFVNSIKRLKQNRRFYHNSIVQKINGKIVVALNYSSTIGNSETHTAIDETKTALVFIEQNKVEIYESPTKQVVSPKRW